METTLRKTKSKLQKKEYVGLYPSGSCPSKFYEIANVRKFSEKSTDHDLPLRTIVPDNGTATYGLAKYLAKLLSPLNQSQYEIKDTICDVLKHVVKTCTVEPNQAASFKSTIIPKKTINIIQCTRKNVLRSNVLNTLQEKQEGI